MTASNQLTVQTQKALKTEGDNMAVKTVCLYPPGRKILKTNKEKESQTPHMRPWKSRSGAQCWGESLSEGSSGSLLEEGHNTQNTWPRWKQEIVYFWVTGIPVCKVMPT